MPGSGRLHGPSLLVIPALFVLAVAAQDCATPSPSIPADAEAPSPPTAESLARAKAIVGFDCVMCHGAAGDGKDDGQVIADLKLTIVAYIRTLRKK